MKNRKNTRLDASLHGDHRCGIYSGPLKEPVLPSEGVKKKEYLCGSGYLAGDKNTPVRCVFKITSVFCRSLC